jgi:hypothetical protein
VSGDLKTYRFYISRPEFIFRDKRRMPVVLQRDDVAEARLAKRRF